MKPYVILLRGINVGGKNIVPMASLKLCLEELGFAGVSTHIASGNALLDSAMTPGDIKGHIEAGLIKGLALDSELIKVLVLNEEQLLAVIDAKPSGFGEEPGKYYSDVIYLMGIDAEG